MVDETPNSRFTEPSESLHEVEPLTNRGVGVIVIALFWCALAEHIGQERSMASLLVSHELDQGHVLGVEASSLEFFFRKAGEAVVEKVELDPLKCVSNRKPDRLQEDSLPDRARGLSTRSRNHCSPCIEARRHWCPNHLQAYMELAEG